MKGLEYSGPWYHGSPYELKTIRNGSTITQNMELAKVFSHKPTCVTMDDHGHIKHNGTLKGYLYIIDEPLMEDDIYPHPETSMAKGLEWLTRREVKVRLLQKVEIKKDGILSHRELNMLMELVH